MKDKKKLYVLIGAVVCVIAAVGIALVGTMKKTPQPVAEVEESVLATDKVVLKDEKTPLPEKIEIPEEDTKEKANGTGETAPIETLEDLQYEQQLAEENGTPMPTETVTMYAVEKADIYKEADEAAKTVGAYAKGDSVDVAKVESEWATVVLSDGVNAYVDAALLANEMPSEKAETAQTQPVPETPVAEVPVAEPQTTPVPEVPQATPSVPGIPSGLTPEEWAVLQSMGATTGPTGGSTEKVVIDPNYELPEWIYNYEAQ